jgi:hypothetical protein
MRLPGDEMVEHPTLRLHTRHHHPGAARGDLSVAIQIGWGRAGWYSYDVLDNLGKRSAEGIIRELQDITVGDWISMGGSR